MKFPNNDAISEIEEEDVTVLEGNRLLYDIDDENGNGSKTLSELDIFDSKFLRIDISPRRPLLLGLIHENETPEISVEFDLIAPKSLKRNFEEDSAVPSYEDELVCLDETDDSVEIIKVDIKKAKIH